MYLGHRVYGTIKREKFGAKKTRQPKEKWVYAYGKHPALVSQELFDRVQVLMDEAENAPNLNGLDELFRQIQALELEF